MNITEERKKNHYFKIFKKELTKYLLTSRFNNATSEENRLYRNSHSEIGCIYCSPSKIAREIPLKRIIFMLEMNNEKNKIMGIGMVRNHGYVNKYVVYSNNNYNRYVYVGKYRIDRSEMSQEEETIMKALDILCFTKNTHMKRGQGLKQFPVKMMYNIMKVIDLLKFINNMFKKRLIEK